jgi:transposase-like protein
MNCSKCKSDEKTKDGVVKGKQRYKCEDCDFRYTVASRSKAKPLHMKKLALHLYLEGLEFRSIGRVLEVSNVTVLNWIRAFGEQIEDLISAESVVHREMAEMHTSVGQKNYRWIWIAVDRYGKRFINFVVGDREVLRQDKSFGMTLKITRRESSNRLLASV